MNTMQSAMTAARASRPWTPAQIEELISLVYLGWDRAALCKHLDRTGEQVRQAIAAWLKAQPWASTSTTRRLHTCNSGETK